MKIRILKDIPGYKAGTDIDSPAGCGTHGFHNGGVGFQYDYSYLIKEGFARDVTDEIDIDAIRDGNRVRNINMQDGLDGSKSAANFIAAYMTVRQVVDQLNELEECGGKFAVALAKNHGGKLFAGRDITHKMFHYSIIPFCRNMNLAERLVELCEPELRVLFNVTNEKSHDIHL